MAIAPVYSYFTDVTDALVAGGAKYLRRTFGLGRPDVAPFSINNPLIRKELEEISAIAKSQYVYSVSGYGPLLVALAQAVVLSAIFILLPLAKLRLEVREGVPRISIIGYFSMLGMAFVLAELSSRDRS